MYVVMMYIAVCCFLFSLIMIVSGCSYQILDSHQVYPVSTLFSQLSHSSLSRIIYLYRSQWVSEQLTCTSATHSFDISTHTPHRYEERSLGVFETPSEDEDEEPENDLAKLGPRERVGRYVGWHLRRQLSIGEFVNGIGSTVPIDSSVLLLVARVDIWWLVWAVFIVAIVERDNLMDDDKKWFDLFRVLFELVSAFGGIGLSLGLPTVCFD